MLVCARIRYVTANQWGCARKVAQMWFRPSVAR